MRIEHDDDAANGTPEERFGAELRRLRERAELTVRRLAQELHRSHSSIVEYERGRRLPGVEVVEQYEEYFGLERGALVAERERARLRRLEEPRDGTVEEHLGDVACPYPGLRAFEFEDAALFFGRESQIERVLARLAEVRFVAVVGPSGSGKSSFVRAGLLARAGAQPTRGRARPRVALVTPGAHPVDELARERERGDRRSPDRRRPARRPRPPRADRPPVARREPRHRRRSVRGAVHAVRRARASGAASSTRWSPRGATPRARSPSSSRCARTSTAASPRTRSSRRRSSPTRRSSARSARPICGAPSSSRPRGPASCCSRA